MEVLTRGEREVVLTAFDCGYFTIPRQAPLAEVAEEIGRDNKETLYMLQEGIGKVIEEYQAELERSTERNRE